MITSRPIEHADLPMLQRALDQDQFEHASTAHYTKDTNRAYFILVHFRVRAVHRVVCSR